MAAKTWDENSNTFLYWPVAQRWFDFLVVEKHLGTTRSKLGTWQVELTPAPCMILFIVANGPISFFEKNDVKSIWRIHTQREYQPKIGLTQLSPEYLKDLDNYTAGSITKSSLALKMSFHLKKTLQLLKVGSFG